LEQRLDSANQTLLELKRQIQTREPRDVIDAVVRFAGRAMQDNSAKPRNFNPMFAFQMRNARP
jgi:hypothetical protein